MRDRDVGIGRAPVVGLPIVRGRILVRLQEGQGDAAPILGFGKIDCRPTDAAEREIDGLALRLALIEIRDALRRASEEGLHVLEFGFLVSRQSGIELMHLGGVEEALISRNAIDLADLNLGGVGRFMPREDRKPYRARHEKRQSENYDPLRLCLHFHNVLLIPRHSAMAERLNFSMQLE